MLKIAAWLAFDPACWKRIQCIISVWSTTGCCCHLLLEAVMSMGPGKAVQDSTL